MVYIILCLARKTRLEDGISAIFLVSNKTQHARAVKRSGPDPRLAGLDPTGPGLDLNLGPFIQTQIRLVIIKWIRVWICDIQIRQTRDPIK